MKHIKTIALLLALVMTLAVFASCNGSGDGDPTDAPATDGTEKPGNDGTDTPGTNTPETPTDKLVLFDEGAFLANVIRAEDADELARTPTPRSERLSETR